MISEPIQPIPNGLLGDVVAFSMVPKRRALLPSDRREDALSRDVTFRSFELFVELAERQMNEATHARSIKLMWKILSSILIAPIDRCESQLSQPVRAF